MRALAVLVLATTSSAFAGSGSGSASPSPGTSDNAVATAAWQAWSIMVEPLHMFTRTLAIGVERRLRTRPSVGIAVLAGVGSYDGVGIGGNLHFRPHYDAAGNESRVRFTRYHTGLQTNMYLSAPFRGPHAGIDVTFKKFFAAEGGDLSVVTASPYLGWKWIFASGFTLQWCGGMSLVYANNFRDGEGDRIGWYFDRRGAAGIGHLFMFFGVGWSF